MLSIVWIDHILFTHPSVNGHLMDTSCFHLLSSMNNASVNMNVHISVQVPAFTSFGYILRSEIASSHGDSMFNILRNFHAIFQSSHTMLVWSAAYKDSSLHLRILVLHLRILVLCILTSTCYYGAFSFLLKPSQ